MKVSGFTIVRNAVKFHYPVLASITSILPICDEFIVNVGDSDDGTLDLVRSIKDPRIRVIETAWDMSKGPTVLSEQTNIESLVRTQRDSVSGVSLDEEMTDLMKYQRAFQASSRVFSVIDDLLDNVVNRLGN